MDGLFQTGHSPSPSPIPSLVSSLQLKPHHFCGWMDREREAEMGTSSQAQACPPSTSIISLPSPKHSFFLRVPFFTLNCTPLSSPCRAATQEEAVLAKSTWVNPRSRKASERACRAFLIWVARALDEGALDRVHHVLTAYAEERPFSGLDAVTVINNMSNPDAAVAALGFFRDCPGLDREIIYNVTLKVLKNSKGLARAEQLFDEMIQRGLAPDSYTFSTLITCARNCKLPLKSVEWFEKMSAFGVCPDAVTFSVMIDAYGRTGNVEMALSLYDRARTENWRLDRIAFTTLIKVHCTRGNFDSCLNLYEEMKAVGLKPNVGTYNILLDAMGRAKRPWQVKSIHADMLREGVSPSASTYHTLLHGFCGCRYGADALRVYREMKDKGMMPLPLIIYNALLAMLAHLGSLQEAVEIYEDMRASEVMTDSWTFSSLVTIFSSIGDVSKVEKVFNEMLEAGIEPTIFVLTSLVQCYGNARLTDNVVQVCHVLFEHEIAPDDQFCGCLLNAMSQSPMEELWKMIECLERADADLGRVVRLLADEQGSKGDFMQAADQLFESVSTNGNAKTVYCNCLIDLCVNLDMLERGCHLLDLGVRLDIYKNLQSRSTIQWSLHIKGLSVGAALIATRAWINDLSRALEAGESLPPVLSINTGHGKYSIPEKSLAGVIESHLKELGAPFHGDPSEVGWFSTTKEAAELWLKSRKEAEPCRS